LLNQAVGSIYYVPSDPDKPELHGSLDSCKPEIRWINQLACPRTFMKKGITNFTEKVCLFFMVQHGQKVKIYTGLRISRIL